MPSHPLGLEARLVDGDAGLAALAVEWRGLLDRVEEPQLSQTPLWLGTWWRTFGRADGRALRAIAFSEGGRLVGFAPLLARRAYHRRLIPFRRLELLGTGEDEVDEICSDYVGILAERGSEARVAEALAGALARGDLGPFDDLVLDGMSGRSPLVPLLCAALTARDMRVTTEAKGQCPYIALPGTFDAYMKTLDAKSRYLVNRSVRELEKWAGEGGYVLHRATNADELAEGTRVLHQLHRARWHQHGHDGAFAQGRFRRFHEAVMAELLAGVDGSLDLLWLTVRDVPVAVLYNIVHRNKVSVYQSGRSGDVPRSLKIGIAMNALAIRDAIERGRAEYDFLNGDSQYKRQLSGGVSRPLVTLRAIAPSLRARSAEAARCTAERLIGRARIARDALRGWWATEKPVEASPEEPA